MIDILTTLTKKKNFYSTECKEYKSIERISILNLDYLQIMKQNKKDYS